LSSSTALSTTGKSISSPSEKKTITIMLSITIMLFTSKVESYTHIQLWTAQHVVQLQLPTASLQP